MRKCLHCDWMRLQANIVLFPQSRQSYTYGDSWSSRCGCVRSKRYLLLLSFCTTIALFSKQLLMDYACVGTSSSTLSYRNNPFFHSTGIYKQTNNIGSLEMTQPKMVKCCLLSQQIIKGPNTFGKGHKIPKNGLKEMERNTPIHIHSNHRHYTTKESKMQ